MNSAKKDSCSRRVRPERFRSLDVGAESITFQSSLHAQRDVLGGGHRQNNSIGRCSHAGSGINWQQPLELQKKPPARHGHEL